MKETDNTKERFLVLCTYGMEKVGLLRWFTPTQVWQIVRYGISGVSGALIQIFFLYTFVDLYGWWYLYGVIASYSLSLIITFTLQKFWTFQDYSIERVHVQSFRYIGIALGAFVLNVVLMYVLVDVMAMWHLSAQIIVVFVAGTLTFLLNKIFTFKISETEKLPLD